MTTPNLNDNEVKVLAALASVAPHPSAGYFDDFGFLSFQAIGHRVRRLDRATIRRSCRSLTRKGLARFGRGLWTEDMEPRGSGYAATKDGCLHADKKLVEKIANRFWD